MRWACAVLLFVWWSGAAWGAPAYFYLDASMGPDGGEELLWYYRWAGETTWTEIDYNVLPGSPPEYRYQWISTTGAMSGGGSVLEMAVKLDGAETCYLWSGGFGLADEQGRGTEYTWFFVGIGASGEAGLDVWYSGSHDADVQNYVYDYSPEVYGLDKGVGAIACDLEGAGCGPGDSVVSATGVGSTEALAIAAADAELVVKARAECGLQSVTWSGEAVTVSSAQAGATWTVTRERCYTCTGEVGCEEGTYAHATGSGATVEAARADALANLQAVAAAACPSADPAVAGYAWLSGPDYYQEIPDWGGAGVWGVAVQGCFTCNDGCGPSGEGCEDSIYVAVCNFAEITGETSELSGRSLRDLDNRLLELICALSPTLADGSPRPGCGTQGAGPTQTGNEWEWDELIPLDYAGGVFPDRTGVALGSPAVPSWSVTEVALELPEGVPMPVINFDLSTLSQGGSAVAGAFSVDTGQSMTLFSQTTKATIDALSLGAVGLAGSMLVWRELRRS